MPVTPTPSMASSAPPQLLDILLPAAPGWWPPAWPWWILLIMLLGLTGMLLWWFLYAAPRRRKARERALRRDAFWQQYLRLRQQNDTNAWGELNRLLRRAACASGIREAMHWDEQNWHRWLQTRLEQCHQEIPAALKQHCYRSARADWEVLDELFPKWLKCLEQTEPSASSQAESSHVQP